MSFITPMRIALSSASAAVAMSDVAAIRRYAAARIIRCFRIILFPPFALGDYANTDDRALPLRPTAPSRRFASGPSLSAPQGRRGQVRWGDDEGRRIRSCLLRAHLPSFSQRIRQKPEHAQERRGIGAAQPR